MKKVFLSTFLTSLLLASSIYPQDSQAKKAALEIIASISDDIAELIINQRQTKDPQVSKQHYIKLITHMADAIAQVIVTTKERKISRDVERFDEEEYKSLIAMIAQQLEQRIEDFLFLHPIA